MKILRTLVTLSLLAILTTILLPVRVFAGATALCQNPVKINTWEGCEPSVTTLGTVRTDSRSAVVSASFNANGAYYKYSDSPTISIQYGNSQGEMYQTTDPILLRYDQTVSFLLENLTEGSPVYYRAKLVWAGGEKYGESKPVVWKSGSSQYIGSSTTNATSTNTTSTSTTSNSSTSSSGTSTGTTTSSNGTSSSSSSNVSYSLLPAGTSGSGIFSGLFGTKSTNGTSSASRFKNVDEKSGLKLAIDDGETQVHQGDTVTLKVRYENNSAKSYTNGTIEIYVPDQYTIETTNKGIHDKVNNMVAISLRDFPAGGFGTAIIIAKATGGSKDLDQAVSQAGLKVGNITLAVADIDEYVASSGSSSSGLGASVSGAKFVPGTLIGWIILLIVLAGIVIVGRRYFVKKDY